MRPLLAGIACGAISLCLSACSPYSGSSNAAAYLGPLLPDVTNVNAIGICTQQGPIYVAVQFQDDAISEYRLPNLTAGEKKPVLQWVRSKAERQTLGDAGCLYAGSPLRDDGADFLVTVDSPGHVDVEVRDAVKKYTPFDDMKGVLQLTGTAVHQAVADHQGYVEPGKTWN